MKFSLALPGQILLVDDTTLWTADGPRIHAVDGTGARTLRAELPVGPLDRVLASSRLARRATRRDIHHMVRFGGRLIVAGYGRLWCIDAVTGSLLGPPVALMGGRPLTLCGSPTGVYYGEYRDNAERAPVRIVFSADGVKWSVLREISGVRHIHGIYRDPFTGDLWMTTGDDGDECAIWRTRDSFASLEVVHRGTQQARAIPLLFTAEFIYFGTDTPLESNYLYRFPRSGGPPERMHPVEGSVFHATQVGTCLIFSTAVEPSAVNRSADCVIYGSHDGAHWRELARHRKDAWSMRYFQYGQLSFPAGENRTGRLWYNTFAVKPDFSVFCGEINVD
jgi:hypothetical protein